MTCRLGKRDYSKRLQRPFSTARMRCKESQSVPRHCCSLVSGLCCRSSPPRTLQRYSARRSSLQVLISQSFMAQTERECRSLFVFGAQGEDLCKRGGKAGDDELLEPVFKACSSREDDDFHIGLSLPLLLNHMLRGAGDELSLASLSSS